MILQPFKNSNFLINSTIVCNLKTLRILVLAKKVTYFLQWLQIFLDLKNRAHFKTR